jgi:hypothetical protein
VDGSPGVGQEKSDALLAHVTVLFLHRAVLAAGEVEGREGFQVTKPLRTLLDSTAGGVSYEQLEKAVGVALSRGMVRKRQLSGAVRKDAGLERLRQAVEGQGKTF